MTIPKKIIILTFFLVTLLLAIATFLLIKKNQQIDFDYLSVNCKIFRTDGKIIFIEGVSSHNCDYAEDGRILTQRPNVKDKNNEIIWQTDESAHHDLKFTKNQNEILMITHDYFDYRGKIIQADCFSKRNAENGEIILEWCLKDHLEEIEKLGFQFSEELDSLIPNSKIFEISHANSINEIPKNSLSDSVEALKAGNYIFNLYGKSGALLILDSNLKKILWHEYIYNLKLEKFPNEKIIGLHDVQIMNDGSMLAYLTTQENEKKYSYIIRRYIFTNPTFTKIIWKSQRHKSINDLTAGKVTELKNGNYLTSELFNKSGEIFVVDKNGREVWHFPGEDANFKKMGWFLGPTPIYDLGFLTSRNLIDE